MSEIYNFLKTVDWDKTLVIMSLTSFSKLDEPIQTQLIENRANLKFSIQNMSTQEVIIKNINACKFTYELSYDTIIETINNKDSLKLVIGIGGGTALDYAKYLAYKLNIDWVAIPSMLSTNAFVTNKVAVIDSTGKHTEQGKLPKTVIFDVDYLMRSPKENLYGLVDVFSIYTALVDWKIAYDKTGVEIDWKIFNRAQTLLSLALRIARSIDKLTYSIIEQSTLQSIRYVVGESGKITNDYGSGRPESGSEHIFASALELAHPMSHALAVTLGIYIMDYFQTSWFIKPHIHYFSIKDIPFNNLGIINDINDLNLSWDLILDVLKSLKPRKDKFTVVDFLVKKSIDFNELKPYLENNGFKFN